MKREDIDRLRNDMLRHIDDHPEENEELLELFENLPVIKVSCKVVPCFNSYSYQLHFNRIFH